MNELIILFRIFLIYFHKLKDFGEERRNFEAMRCEFERNVTVQSQENTKLRETIRLLELNLSGTELILLCLTPITLTINLYQLCMDNNQPTLTWNRAHFPSLHYLNNCSVILPVVLRAPNLFSDLKHSHSYMLEDSSTQTSHDDMPIILPGNEDHGGTLLEDGATQTDHDDITVIGANQVGTRESDILV